MDTKAFLQLLPTQTKRDNGPALFANLHCLEQSIHADLDLWHSGYPVLPKQIISAINAHAAQFSRFDSQLRESVDSLTTEDLKQLLTELSTLQDLAGQQLDRLLQVPLTWTNRQIPLAAMLYFDLRIRVANANSFALAAFLTRQIPDGREIFDNLFAKFLFIKPITNEKSHFQLFLESFPYWITIKKGYPHADSQESQRTTPVSTPSISSSSHPLI